ncbi:uncharacterized protein FMAN_00433 [Fusarium mangiferae]|uniref:Uncharacterized protein n=1 Tax=Fusarium mangiferae TaxID=192010 RepID=A0A1L7U568_FUSMA|nr:uncharacterized protein FMAN_00433 [Fusarium mangiferae]CVL03105.1 uncharacterized protein FMAN_00433 [Fusarium mangiferae]
MHCRYVQLLSKRIEDLALIGIIEVITDVPECFIRHEQATERSGQNRTQNRINP